MGMCCEARLYSSNDFGVLVLEALLLFVGELGDELPIDHGIWHSAFSPYTCPPTAPAGAGRCAGLSLVHTERHRPHGCGATTLRRLKQDSVRQVAAGYHPTVRVSSP